ncbi:MAG: hypothetical protein H0W73_19470 [Bacteroidetes bacterium]|nr:hypothetical protein [Bacteroidota bacterium]
MKISINEPCHENWDKMTPNDKGAFCLSCQKNVVDFSNKTITQIKDFFKKKESNESVCGRFDESQLDALTFDDFFSEFLKMKFVRKVALIVFFVFGLSLFASAQTAKKHPPEMRPKMGAVAYVPQDTTKKVCKKDTVEEMHIIKGKVKYDPDKNKKSQPKNKKMMGEPMIEDKNAK